MKYLTIIITCLCLVQIVQAQPYQKGFFSVSSPMDKDARGYGSVTVSASTSAIVIGTVLAYGENVKGLTVKINNGFAYKLAPAQSGSTLNYVGSNLQIVLQPFEKAVFEFVDAENKSGAKQLHISGEVKE